MIGNDSKKSPKIAPRCVCSTCDYVTSKSSDFKKHLATDKHRLRANGSDMVGPKSPKVAVGPLYVCECGRAYKYDSGYYRHRKTCVQMTSVPHGVTSELILELIQDNKEMKQIILEQNATIHSLVKNGVIHNVTYNNSNNKAFNLNVFLNETCKHAMNINDFVDSIKVQLSDLERFGEVGYIENISHIIANNLKALDVTERPVHCTDKKRETIYIKDADKWEKEDDNKTRLRKAIRKIASKNYRLLPEFREKYPGCQYADSQYSDKYNKMVVEAMGGTGNEDEKEDKIIKNISKNVLIQKG